MRILKRQHSNIGSDESVFSRSSTQIEYSLETKVKDEDHQDNLNDFLPLLLSNSGEMDIMGTSSSSPIVSNQTKGKKKHTRNTSAVHACETPVERLNGMKESPLIRTPSRTIKSKSGKKSSSKRSKIRSLFSKSGSAKKEKGKQYSHRRMSSGSSGEVPQLVRSGDTEDDSEQSYGELPPKQFDVTFLDRLMAAETRTPEPPLPPQLRRGGDTAQSPLVTIPRTQSYPSLNSEKDRHWIDPSPNDGDEKEDSMSQNDSSKVRAQRQSSDADSKNYQGHNENERDTVNVLNDIVAMEQSARNSVSLDNNGGENEDGYIFEGEDYHAVISDLVSKRLKLEERIHKLEEKTKLCADNDDSSKDLADILLHGAGSGEAEVSKSFDDQETVMTVKASNCSQHPARREKNGKLNSTIAHVVTTGITPKEDPIATAEKRLRKTMSMYEETLSLSKSAFKDLNHYHTTMVNAATKMATLLMSMNENQSAKKYFDIANSHTSETTSRTPVEETVGSNSDDESYGSCSTSSSNYELDLVTQLSF